ncbi:uncharacterized protein METZ01_LOCUS430705 [marine metagenome]|uniref:EthD domain-containing protein n=1 Tax=marine metagenome TaxID=408172 RepID=A0A382Y4X3_9ZZZZ
MIIRFGMAPRLPEWSFEAFQNYWATSHADAAGAIPGLLAYTQNHSVLVDGKPLLPYPGFDACSELAFESVESMNSGFSSEKYLESVRQDEDAFIDKSRFSLALVREQLMTGDLSTAPNSTTKVITAFRHHPSANGNSLTSVICNEVTDSVAEDEPLAQRVLVTDHQAHTGLPPAVLDAVFMAWFSNLDRAQAHLRSANRARAELALAGLVFGRVDLLATEIHVVAPCGEAVH